MAIFNSLGSNYNFGFVLRALIAGNKESYRLQLAEYLKKKYKGEVLLTYKGREALRLALRIANLPKKYTVGICGFTCYAVYEAIKQEGYRTGYLDIADDDLNFSFEKFADGIHKYPSMKALVVQNTLGFPCDMRQISKFCKDRNIILIEDLAHSIGAKYLEGQEAGMVGDFTVLSFSQDKMIDGISGGAVIIKDQRSKIKDQRFVNLPLGQQWKDRFYPLFTWIIRKTYGIGVGKLLHAVLKKFNLLSKPMSRLQKNEIFGLPNWYCYLIYRQFMGLEQDLILRRKIASVYADGLSKSILSGVLTAQISRGSDLRFPIFVEKRGELIAFLKKQGIFVSDIWYDSPIAPKSYLQLTDYNHECLNSEKASSMIVNLPTHRNVSEKDAKYIVEKVNEWLE
jgi:dTDP-4-amino-4,6-dideoxygalactose transaminase